MIIGFNLWFRSLKTLILVFVFSCRIFGTKVQSLKCQIWILPRGIFYNTSCFHNYIYPEASLLKLLVVSPSLQELCFVGFHMRTYKKNYLTINVKALILQRMWKALGIWTSLCYHFTMDQKMASLETFLNPQFIILLMKLRGYIRFLCSRWLLHWYHLWMLCKFIAICPSLTLIGAFSDLRLLGLQMDLLCP